MNKKTQDVLKIFESYTEMGMDYSDAMLAIKEALEQPAWQGLTDDENEAIIQSIWEWGNDFPYDEYRICIEQALKEKNHGI
jgi:hypothetical protein